MFDFHERFSFSPSVLAKDLLAGTIVFLVALPLCLGIAIASDADPIAGLISGIVGGIVTGLVSGSATSVSGPAAGLTAIVAAQIAGLGTYETFLTAVVMAGAIQIGFGLLRAGALSAFFPSSVIKGLLAAMNLAMLKLWKTTKNTLIPWKIIRILWEISLLAFIAR
jgi:carbonic anhydrase